MTDAAMLLAQGVAEKNPFIEAVAEGVEHERVCAALRNLGCPYAQGFMFSRPVFADQALALLQSNVEAGSDGS